MNDVTAFNGSDTSRYHYHWLQASPTRKLRQRAGEGAVMEPAPKRYMVTKNRRRYEMEIRVSEISFNASQLFHIMYCTTRGN